MAMSISPITRGAALMFLAVFLCPPRPAAAQATRAPNGALLVNPGAGELGSLVNAAIAQLPTAGGEVDLPPGAYSFSTPILITDRTVILRCGASATSNVTVHGTTRLKFTGSTSGAVLTLTGPGTTGSQIIGCMLGNSGRASLGILIDHGANSVLLDNVVLDDVNVPFSVAGIQIGSHATWPVDVMLRRVVVRRAGPVGLKIMHVAAHAVIIDSRIFENSLHNVEVGGTGGGEQAISVHFYGSTIESFPGLSSFVIYQGESVSFDGGYCEQGEAAASGQQEYCFDIPSNAVFARNISITHTTMRSVVGTPSRAAVHSGFSGSQLNLGDNHMAGYANPGYLVENDGAQKIFAYGNDLQFSGAQLVTGSAGLRNVVHLGNTAAGVLIPSYLGR